MKILIEDNKNELIDLSIGLKAFDIDKLIFALNILKENKSHFHFRSIGKIDKGVSDVEIYWAENEEEDNMEIESAPPIEPNRC